MAKQIIVRPAALFETVKEIARLLYDISKAFTRSNPGSVPPPGGTGSTRFLCEDGEWRVP